MDLWYPSFTSFLINNNLINKFIFLLADVLRKLGFEKEYTKENSIDEDEEIPEAEIIGATK